MMAKASKKYAKERFEYMKKDYIPEAHKFEYAHMHEYYGKPYKDDLRGSVTKKPRFSDKPAVSSEKKNKKIRSTKINHPYETGD
jgi:hypothetical protein